MVDPVPPRNAEMTTAKPALEIEGMLNLPPFVPSAKISEMRESMFIVRKTLRISDLKVSEGKSKRRLRVAGIIQFVIGTVLQRFQFITETSVEGTRK